MQILTNFLGLRNQSLHEIFLRELKALCPSAWLFQLNPTELGQTPKWMVGEGLKQVPSLCTGQAFHSHQSAKATSWNVWDGIFRLFGAKNVNHEYLPFCDDTILRFCTAGNKINVMFYLIPIMDESENTACVTDFHYNCKKGH